MKKSNPLFVDTTKFNGDALFTQVELNDIPEYIGATVVIKVSDKGSGEQSVELERASVNQCVGRVFLTYRQEISYEFVVYRNDEAIFKSEMKACEASYLIQETWRPISLKTDELSLPELLSAENSLPQDEIIVAQDAVELP